MRKTTKKVYNLKKSDEKSIFNLIISTKKVYNFDHFLRKKFIILSLLSYFSLTSLIYKKATKKAVCSGSRDFKYL